MKDNIEVPKWDPALESLIDEEVQKLKRPLKLADFDRLSKDYSIRFDDLMVTLFELCFEGRWQYFDDKGKPREITRDEVNRLFVNRRIKQEDVTHLTGNWKPY